MNGYQLIKALEERTGGSWRPSPGAVYPALAQLQDEGLVEPADGDGKVFQLTESGRAAAAEAGEQARPWQAQDREPAPESAPSADLRHAVNQLTIAARAAAESGDEALMRQAVAQVAAARREIYRLLADPTPTDDDPQD